MLPAGRTGSLADRLSDDTARGLLEAAPSGVLVVDVDGSIHYRNERAADIVGADTTHVDPALAAALGHGPAQGSGELVVLWRDRRRLEVRCQVVRAESVSPLRVAWLTDVTRDAAARRRLAAIAAVSSTVADVGDLDATLHAIAAEVARADEIAAAQIITFDESGSRVRLLGTAGFTDTTNFIPLLHHCQRLGADLRMLDAAGSGAIVTVAHRKPMIMDNPSWAPLHAIMDQPDWDSFAAVPLLVSGRTAGVLNVFFAPQPDPPDEEELEFLTAMAEQAALALDRAELVGAAELQAREEERHRVAADLHDSVVQQVFSIAMHAEALQELGGVKAAPDIVARHATALSHTARAALADLRSLIVEMRPTGLGDDGLIASVRSFAGSVSARTGLLVDVVTDLGFIGLPTAVEDDVYRIVQEALGNVVKHAEATTVTIRIAAAGATDNLLVIDLLDDGVGFPVKLQSTASLGMVSMRERARRCGGSVVLRSMDGAGGHVRVTVPLAEPPERAGGQA